MTDKNIIEIQGKLYHIIRKFPIERINLDKHEDSVSLLKQYYHIDTMFKAKGLLWLCNKVDDIEYKEIDEKFGY